MSHRLRIAFSLFAIAVLTGFLYYTGPAGCAGNKCGNGVLDAGEACDDGNNVDGDGCSALCQIESAGTTGGETTGGTTGGTTTGGTTGGTSGAACDTPADCPESFSSPSVCYDPPNCQGERADATCIGGTCGSVLVPDDSGCTADSYTRDCGDPINNPGGSCDGTVAQKKPFCEHEICDDGPIPPNVNTDDDGDGLINCADTVDCPDSTACTTDYGSPAYCYGGSCQD